MIKRLVVLAVIACIPILVFAQTAPGKTNMFGWVVPEKTLEINFYQADRGDQAQHDRDTQQIRDFMLKEFNVKLVKNVSDVDTTEKLNLMLASGNYPKIIMAMSADTVSQWAAQGHLYNMAPDVEKTYKGIKSTLGYLYGMYLTDKKELFGLPRGWGLLPIPDQSAHIRWDWYQEMGSPKIATPDDYYNVIKKMVAAHPKNANGEKVYGISWSTDQVKVADLMAIWGLKDGYKEDAQNNLSHWVNTPEGLQAVLWLNKFYREGLMDPEAFVNKYDNWKAKFSAERIVGHIGGWWQSWNAGHEIWSKSPGWTDDKRYVQISIKDPAAKVAYFTPKNTLGWNYTVITDKATAQDRADYMRFFEWAISPMAVRIFGWGVPNLTDASDGKASFWTTDGKNWEFNDQMKKIIMAGAYDQVPNWNLRGTGEFFITQGQALTKDAKPSTVWADQNFNSDPAPEAKWRVLMNKNLEGTEFDFTAFEAIKFLPENVLTTKRQQIKDAEYTGFVKAVQSNTVAEATANFNALKATLNKLGLADLEKFQNVEYKKNLAKMKL